MKKSLGVVLCVLLWMVVGINNAPPAAPAERWNILHIITDDQTAAPSSITEAMPYVNSQPDGHWVLFSDAGFEQPLCCPSRCTLLTGQEARHHHVVENDGTNCLDANSIALPLAAAGYRPILVGKELNGYGNPDKGFRGDGSVPPGWADWHAFYWGADYLNFKTSDNGVINDHVAYADDYFADQVISSIDATPAGQPFYLWWGLKGPHGPRIACDAHYLDSNFPSLPLNNGSINEADVSDKPPWVQALPLLTTIQRQRQEAHRLDAYRTLRCVDDYIARVVQHLEATGQIDNTMIILQSDNGYSFGERRFSGKNTPYQESLKMVLRIRWPSAPLAGTTVHRLVLNTDLAETILDVAGATATWQMDGRSLRPVINGSAPGWPTFRLFENQGDKNDAVPKYWGTLEKDWKLVQYEDGFKELYDLAGDIRELTNHAGDPVYALTQARLQAELDCMLAELCSPRG